MPSKSDKKPKNDKPKKRLTPNSACSKAIKKGNAEVNIVKKKLKTNK